MGTPNVKRLTVAISLRLPVALLEGLNVAAKKRDAPFGEAGRTSAVGPFRRSGGPVRARAVRFVVGHALRQRRHDVIALEPLPPVISGFAPTW